MNVYNTYKTYMLQITYSTNVQKGERNCMRLSDYGLQYNYQSLLCCVSDFVGLYCYNQSLINTHQDNCDFILALGGQKSMVKYKYTAQALQLLLFAKCQSISPLPRLMSSMWLSLGIISMCCLETLGTVHNNNNNEPLIKKHMK